MLEDRKNIKVALVHDFLTGLGGAERVLESFCEMFPDAPIYTILYDKKAMRGKFSQKIIRTSFLQKLPKFIRKRKKWLLPLLPVTPEIFDLRDFDLVISSSGAWSKGIVTRLNTIHISYVHSPMRFVWDVNGEYVDQQRTGVLISFFSRWILNYIRLWDKSAADRPDYLVANSEYTQKRIRKYYGRESTVIYPPVNVQNEKLDSSHKKEDGGHFLIVSRLSPYKKIDAVIEAFNKLELPLVIIGEGPQEKYLRSIAKGNIRILGYQSDKEVSKYYRGARGFIFAGVDDFGIAPIEAMGRGIPVLAIRKGGAKELILEGRTGEFFDAATPEVIADGVRRMIESENSYQREYIQSEALKFNPDRFKKEFWDFLDKIVHD